MTGVNRGNIDSYEKNSQPKPEFLVVLAKEFGINMQMMLSTMMTVDNYHEFVLPDNEEKESSEAKPQSGRKFRKSDFFNVMQKIKETDSYTERQILVDNALEMVSILEDEKSEVQEELIGLIKKLRSF